MYPYQFGNWADKIIQPFFFIFKKKTFFLTLTIFFIQTTSLSQDLDVDELLERLDRIEKNISDIQKGKIEKLENSLSSGYISRNETKLGDFETKIRTNFGLVEEIDNKIQNLDDKLNLIDKDFQSKLTDIQKKLKLIENKLSQKRKPLVQTLNENKIKELNEMQNGDENLNNDVSRINEDRTSINNLNENDIKKKYENAIKMLWANKYVKAEKELIQLKKISPNDLMPNIQYWLGEVHYAQKNFERAIIEFGEGLKKYPDSIKGPDNMLKLALSFSNLERKDDACNVLYELQIKYKDAPKNVIERSLTERKKLNCPKE